MLFAMETLARREVGQKNDSKLKVAQKLGGGVSPFSASRMEKSPASLLV